MMSKKTINKKEKLSSALKENIKGKRLLKVGYSSLLHKKLNNE